MTSRYTNTRDEPNSRLATDLLLAGLREGRWRPYAWALFLRTATARSLWQARLRPRALAELTVLHAVLAARASRDDRGWVLMSWALGAAHLGMLERQRSLGLANVVTITRANLPVLTSVWWLPVLALTTDVVDGRMARANGTASRFGAAADSLADTTFWTWFAFRHEAGGRARAVALLAWALPVAGVTATSVGRGRMVDVPRPRLLRPAAALQAALTARAVLRAFRLVVSSVPESG